MHNRASLHAAAAAAAALGLAGVMALPSLAAAVKIEYANGPTDDITKQLVAEFNQQYQGQIEVDQVSEDLAVTVAGGAPPDLVWIDRFTNGSDAAHGLLTDLDPFIQADNVNSKDFWPAAWGECVYNGMVTCIPSDTDSRALFYNKEIFSAAGLDPNNPPRTWDDLVAYGNKMDRQDGSGKYTQVGFNPNSGNWYFVGWLWSAGGSLLDPSYHQVTWNSEQGIEAAQFMEDRVKHYGSNLAAGMGELQNGTAGMVMEGSWNIGGLVHNNTTNVKWGAAGAPRPNGMQGQPETWSGGFALGIPKGAAHPQAAWTFIKWFTSQKPQVDYGAATGEIPATLAAAHDIRFYTLNNLIPVFVKILAYSHFRPVIPSGQELWNIYAGQVDAQLAEAKLPAKEILDTSAQLGQIELQKGWDLAAGKTEAYAFPTSSSYVTVDISKLFNNNGIAPSKNVAGANLDGGGYALDADGLPAGGQQQQIDKIPFLFPKVDGLDNLEPEQMTLKLPAGNYNGLYLLATGTNGGQTGLAKLNYSDGSSTSFLLNMSDWCGGSASGEELGPKPKDRLNASGPTTPACGMFVEGIAADPSKQLTGVSLPEDANMHIFALTLGKK